MNYEVIITERAKALLDSIINYILLRFNNEQAALNVMDDAENTKVRLSHVAGSLRLCEDSRLRDLGYRTIHFRYHRYFMLYRIEDGTVYVDGVYHDLQNDETILL